MAEDIYSGLMNTKHNLDGEEDVNEVFIMPRENIRFREKIIRIREHVTLSETGIHLDRDGDPYTLDNGALNLDAVPTTDPVEIAVICPFDALNEQYYDEEFVNTTSTTALFDSANSRYVLDDGELVISEIIQYLPTRAFKYVTVIVNSNNSTDALDRYIATGTTEESIISLETGDSLLLETGDSLLDETAADTWTQLTDDQIFIPYNIVNDKLKYKIVNTTGSTKNLNRLDVSFIYH